MVELDQQVVVAEAPVFTDAAADRFADFGQHFPTRPSEPPVEDRAQRPRRFLQAVERVEQRVLGYDAPLPASLRQARPAVAAEDRPAMVTGYVLLRQPGRGCGERRIEPPEVFLDPRGPVAVPVEPTSIPQIGPDSLPVPFPFDPRRVERAPPPRLPFFERSGRRLAPHDGDPGLRAPGRDPLGNLAREEPTLHRVAYQQHRGGVQPPAPEVPHRAGHHRVVSAAHLEPEGEPAFEREVGQHPLAEAVDGVHARAVDVVHRGLQPPCRFGRPDPARALPAGKELHRLGVRLPRSKVRPRGTDLQRVEGGPEGAADPVPELRGGGAGEGDDEDAIELLAFLHHEAGDQGGERVGLAGSRAGLDERRSAPAEREVGRCAAGIGCPDPGFAGRIAPSVHRVGPSWLEWYDARRPTLPVFTTLARCGRDAGPEGGAQSAGCGATGKRSSEDTAGDPASPDTRPLDGTDGDP